jgi:hypothetical protein
VYKESLYSFSCGQVAKFPITCCYATTFPSLSILRFNAIETMLSNRLLGSMLSALLVLYGRSRAGAGLSTLGGVRAETADQRALSSVVIAETRWSGYGEEVGVASSSPGLSMVGSSMIVLGCVYSSAWATWVTFGSLKGGSGGKATPVFSFGGVFLWRRYKT